MALYDPIPPGRGSGRISGASLPGSHDKRGAREDLPGPGLHYQRGAGRTDKEPGR